MDPKLQASFIPKRPLMEGGPMLRPSAGKDINIFFFVSVVIFVISLLLAGGVFLLNYYENSQIDKAVQTLAEIPKKYPLQQMQDLTRLDTRIETTKAILKKHLAISGVLNLLGQVTSKNVRFTDFKYDDTAGVSNSRVAPTISLKGQAKSFNSVAFQSDLMRANTFFKNPIFSGLHADDKGSIVFSIDGTLDPAVSLYSATLPQSTTVATTTTTLFSH
jgi:Tfp pilus assembly protein PilN